MDLSSLEGYDESAAATERSMPKKRRETMVSLPFPPFFCPFFFPDASSKKMGSPDNDETVAGSGSRLHCFFGGEMEEKLAGLLPAF